jgi:hypothetical protein
MHHLAYLLHKEQQLLFMEGSQLRGDEMAGLDVELHQFYFF